MSNPGFGSSQEEEESRKVSTFAVGVELTKKRRTAVRFQITSTIRQIRANIDQCGSRGSIAGLVKHLKSLAKTSTLLHTDLLTVEDASENDRQDKKHLMYVEQIGEAIAEADEHLKSRADEAPSEGNGGRAGRVTEEEIRAAKQLIEQTRQFKRVARLVREGDEKCVSRFHPKEPVLACGIENEIIFFSAENWSISFSNWKEDENKFQIGHEKEITTMEWNADGSQLAAIAYNESEITVWSYPSGEIVFEKKLDERVVRIEWNPFMPNLFATFWKNFSSKVPFFNSCPVNQRPFHFCTIKRENWIQSVQWISENRVALGLNRGREIEIWEINESTNSAKLFRRFQHKKGFIVDMAWDERTESLAACSDDGWMTIWSMDSDQPIHATKVGDKCHSFAWRPNGKQTDGEGVDAARKLDDNFILVGGLDMGKIVVWTPLAEEKTRILISQRSSCVDSLSFSPDGRFLASADINGKWIIWATENWEPVYIGTRFSKPFSWLSSSTDVPDYKLTFNSNDGKIRVVEYAEARRPAINSKPKLKITRIAKEKETRAENGQSDPVAT